jgi:hypothetical protein
VVAEAGEGSETLGKGTSAVVNHNQATASRHYGSLTSAVDRTAFGVCNSETAAVTSRHERACPANPCTDLNLQSRRISGGTTRLVCEGALSQEGVLSGTATEVCCHIIL